jgi:glycosyltransferase involved in cell wall biosynthesis
MHVVHLITGLCVSGTPAMLIKLAQAAAGRVRMTVIGMTPDRQSVAPLEALGIPVHTLDMRRGRPSPRAFWKLCSLLRRDPPDVLQTWLYHADLMGLAAAKAVVGCPVVWNIRHATLTPGVDSRSTLLAARMSAKLSRRGPAAIAVNSRTGLEVHAAAGYDRSKLVLIPNGFDLERFRPDSVARSAIRRKLGIADDAPAIGLLARYSSLKGHPTFIDAMRRVHAARPDAQFMLCGSGIDRSNAELASLIDATGCPERFHLLGERRDVPAVQAALDLAVSASTSEAFSNSIGEALACGVPVVTTDVGDSADLVGDAGRIVPIGDSAAMAAGCLELLSLDAGSRMAIQRQARERMAERFEIGVIAERYLQLWSDVARKKSIAA